MSTEALVVAEPVESGAIAVRRDPHEILAEAHKAAAALQEVLDSKKDQVTMGGERYLEVDDWQTVGRFYGVTAKVETTDFKVYEIPGRDPIFGFDAIAVAISPDGRVLSRAEASCLSDEEKWGARPKYASRYAKKAQQQKGPDNRWHTVIGADGKPIVEDWYDDGYEPARGEPLVWIPNPNKPGKSMPYKERVLVGTENVPLFQMKSMAQTRASSKVYRQVLAFVPVMAGYKPTPAEELEGYGAERVTRNGADVRTGEIIDAEMSHPPADTADATAQLEDQRYRESAAGQATAQRAAQRHAAAPIDQTELPEAGQTHTYHVTAVVKLKSGQNDGGEWILYGIETTELGPKQYVATLDAASARTAMTAKTQQVPVEMIFATERKGQYTNRSLTEIRLLNREPGQEG